LEGLWRVKLAANLPHPQNESLYTSLPFTTTTTTKELSVIAVDRKAVEWKFSDQVSEFYLKRII
jgi:hypothetical protein